MQINLLHVEHNIPKAQRALMDKLKKDYEAAVKAYIDFFCEKQGVSLEYWAAGIVGGVACFGDTYLNFEDVRLDVDSHAPLTEIFIWYDQSIEAHTKGDVVPNYQSYLMGIGWLKTPEPSASALFTEKEFVEILKNSHD